VRARKRAYDIGSILETTKAVHALGFDLEQKKTENFVFSVRPGVVAWTHLVGISERADLRCIALDHRWLPRVQQFWDPQNSSGTMDGHLSFTPHNRDAKTLTSSSGPTECRGANTDWIEHHRLAVLIRVAARSDHAVMRLHGPEIDEQTAGNARKVCLFGFSLSHDGRAAQRERDVGGLCLHYVVRDLV
jgi:hypothetical protein